MENPINYWYQKYLSLKAEMDKMKAGAVEGEIMTNGFYPYEPRIVASVPGTPFEFGEKIRVIVLPKED